MEIVVRSENENDRKSVWDINRAAFDSEDEANLVDALRDGGYVEVSLVAEADGKIVGHILFSRVSIITNSGTTGAVSIAPVAVLPSHQRQGIGSELVKVGLEACRRQGHKIAVVLGHPNFYPRLGFSWKLAQPLESPFGGGDAWMATELTPGALADIQGRVEYSPPFGELD
jgi:putative acetyltransferase